MDADDCSSHAGWAGLGDASNDDGAAKGRILLNLIGVQPQDATRSAPALHVEVQCAVVLEWRLLSNASPLMKDFVCAILRPCLS